MTTDDGKDRLITEALAIIEKCTEGLKDSRDLLEILKPQVEEYKLVIAIMKDYLDRLAEATKDDVGEVELPNAHDYLMMIAKIMSNKL